MNKYPEGSSRTVLRRTLEILDHGVIVNPAQDFLLHQAKLFSCGQLPFAGETSKAGQVVGISTGSPDPVAGVDLPPATGTLCTKPTTKAKSTEKETVRALECGEEDQSLH